MISITVIILTHNEEKHIERCIKSVKDIAQRIVLVDCYSQDKTIEIAKESGAEVYSNAWINYSSQFNWALDNIDVATDWVFRLDADEYITKELSDEISQKVPTMSDHISAINLNRRVFFMGRWMKHGGIYPLYLPRIWRAGCGTVEDRHMDEHLVLSKGGFISFKKDFIDDNRNTLDWWINKHVKYATREALDISLKKELANEDNISPKIWGTQAERKRFCKKIYLDLPLFVRPTLYFIWRYFVKFGFLDGKEGIVWNFLQAYWYRMYVDSILFEAERESLRSELTTSEWLLSRIQLLKK